MGEKELALRLFLTLRENEAILHAPQVLQFIAEDFKPVKHGLICRFS